MAELVVFILVTFGITNIVTLGKIFEPIRRRTREDSWVGTLIRCPMCFGFWVGLLVSLAGLRVTPDLLVLAPYSSHVLDGGIGSGSTWAVHVILCRLGSDDL